MTSLTKKALRNGFFISFEGGEGAGKSTQIKLLAQHLQMQGEEVLITREPGGTKGAEIVRHILLTGAAEKYGVMVETLLFAAARADHVDEVIAPALQAGKIVLCDRFIDSTRVYQGTSDKMVEGKKPPAYLAILEHVAIIDTFPNLTFILDLPASIGLERVRQRRAEGESEDRFEKQAIELHERRRQAFLKIGRQESQRCIIIDANRPIEEIAQTIAEATDKRIR